MGVTWRSLSCGHLLVLLGRGEQRDIGAASYTVRRQSSPDAAARGAAKYCVIGRDRPAWEVSSCEGLPVRDEDAGVSH